jgi:membrane protein implicated in regulation of membrane protease activity
MILTALWFVGYAAAVATMPDTPAWITAATLLYVVYYTVASLVLTVRRRRGATSGATSGSTSRAADGAMR